MKRKFLTLALLSAVTLIIFCGENGLELNTITNPVDSEVLAKMDVDKIINGRLLRMRPVPGEYKIEIIEKSGSKMITRLTGIKNFSINLPDQPNQKILVSGEIQSLVYEQSINGEKYGPSILVSIDGSLNYEELKDDKSTWQKH